MGNNHAIVAWGYAAFHRCTHQTVPGTEVLSAGLS
jgi:hypothetical protein